VSLGRQPDLDLLLGPAFWIVRRLTVTGARVVQHQALDALWMRRRERDGRRRTEAQPSDLRDAEMIDQGEHVVRS